MKKLVLFLVVFMLGNANLEAAPQDLKLKLDVEKYTLPNGLRVLLHQDSSIPMVSYHTWYKVGSRDESQGVTGAAHMLEHMMFKGAKKYSGKQFDRILHENGITNNAFTSWDYTGFYQNLPSHRLELMMDMEVDRMRYLQIAPEDLKSELQVVAEERRWRTDNNPMGLLREALFAQIFKGTPYSWPVIGHMKDIQSYSSEKLRFFYDTYYVPNNAILVIAGDIDISKTKKWVEKYYGPLESKQMAERNYPKMHVGHKPERILLKKDVQNATLMWAYPSVTAHEDDSFALEVLGSILGSGISSRFVRDLVYEKQLASSAGAFQLGNDASGLFGISVSVRPGQSIEKVETAVKNQIKKLLAEGVTEEELQKAKNQIMKDYVDSLLTLDGKARTLATNEIIFSDYKKFFTDLPRYQGLNKAQILEVAKKYLKNESEVFIGLLPNK